MEIVGTLVRFSRGLARSAFACTALGALLCLELAVGVPAAAQAHSSEAMDVFAGASVGTARAPVSSPMDGRHAQLGEWSVMVHGSLSLNTRWDPAPRGEASTYFTNMIGASARRRADAGWFELRAMASAEPAMGARGYSLLLQTGETADGINPLVDRQHPHDILMELSGSFRFEIDRDAWLFVYVAPIGSPALGPVPFMHRASGGENPVTPISHHFLDATHIAYGVATIGLYVDRRIQLEVSYFNAREPDQNRWVPEAPKLNSFSTRLTITPGRNWAIQGSFADLKEPEQLHPAIDLYRMTLSATHHRPLSRGFWSTTLAFGQNKRPETTMSLGEARARLPAPILDHYLSVGPLPPGADDTLLLLFERRTQSAVLLESALQWGRTTGFFRYESARKDELFPPTDLRHSELFTVRKVNVGLLRDFDLGGNLDLGIGGTASLHSVPGALRAEYGNRPISYMLFTRVKL